MYSQCVRLTNPADYAVTFTVKPGSPERYTVLPSGPIRLEPNHSTLLEVRLKLLRAPKKRGGQRDVFHIHADLFEQKFFGLFYIWGQTPPTAPSGGGAVPSSDPAKALPVPVRADLASSQVMFERDSTRSRSNSVRFAIFYLYDSFDTFHSLASRVFITV